MNGPKHPKGCHGAVLSNGTPIKSYCEGNGGKSPWWKDCCTWTGKECVPKGIVCKMKNEYVYFYINRANNVETIKVYLFIHSFTF